jgi:Tol biopolymer transport system component
MGPNGEEPRRVVGFEGGYDIQGPKWAPDGRRIVYLKNPLTSGESSVETRTLADGSTKVVFTGKGILDFWWTSDGRLIYTQAEDSNQACGLWQVAIDPASGRADGKPRRLTRWVGFSPGFVSVSTDGRRVTTTKGYSQSDVYVAELEADGKKLRPPRQVTFDTRADWPAGWISSKEILFFSDRNGAFNIFKQAPDAHDAEPLVAGSDDVRDPQISAGGKWLLYALWPVSKPAGPRQPVRLMRVPVSGGTPESVFEARGAFASGISWKNREKVFPNFKCPASGGPCVLAEAEEKEVVFTAFDPIQGRTAEFARLPASPEDFFWDVAPDGSRIVYGEFSWGGEGYLTVLTIADGSTKKIPLPGQTNLNSVSWSPDKQAFFLTTLRREGSALLGATETGKVDVLLDQNGHWMLNPRLSPDKRLLAFAVSATDSNVWLIETR